MKRETIRKVMRGKAGIGEKERQKEREKEMKGRRKKIRSRVWWGDEVIRVGVGEVRRGGSKVAPAMS